MPTYSRMTVNLTETSEHALAWLSESTDLNRTDVVNRALQLYKYVHEATAVAGHKLQLVSPTGQVETIRILP
jgi:hypothetical protein